MLNEKYNRMLEKFELYYPDLHRQAIDWWPSGRLCITLRLEDDYIFEYDSVSNTIRKIESNRNRVNDETLRKEIGHNIQKLIQSRSISQSTIATECGITPAMLSRYIHGTSMPGIDKVYSLANILGCRITDILGDYSME